MPLEAHRYTLDGTVRIPAALICALCIALYWSALPGPLLFDDMTNVVGARLDAFSWRGLAQVALSNESGMLGRALPVASFTLNWTLSGQDAVFAMKATNLALHLVNTLLVLVLVRTLIRIAGTAVCGTASLAHANAVALIVAALWALHPLQVSTVMYVVQRMALMSATFTLLALIAYLRMRSTHPTGLARIAGWAAATIACTLLACFSKENGALIPLYLLLLEFTVLAPVPGQRRPWQARTAIALSGLAVIGVLAVLSTRFATIAQGYGARDFTLTERLWAQARIVVEYIGWIAIPDTTQLTFFHDHIGADAMQGPVALLCAVVLGALLGGAVLARRQAPVCAFGVLLFLSSHLLESTAIPLELVFEHRNYLGSAGWLLAIVAGGTHLARRHGRTGLPIVATLLFTGLGATATAHHARTWGDHVALALHATEHAPTSERAWIELAAALQRREQHRQAIAVFDEADRYLPDSPLLALHRLDIAWHAGLHDDGLLTRAQDVLARHPVTPPVALLLGRMVDAVSDRKHDRPTAQDLRTLFDAALPGNAYQLNEKGLAHLLFQYHRLLLEGDRFDEAAAIVSRLTVLLPDNGEIAARAAETYVLAGQPERAVHELARARARVLDGDASTIARLSRIEQRIEQRIEEQRPARTVVKQ